MTQKSLRGAKFAMLFFLGSAAISHSQEARNTSYRMPSGERVLRHEIEIPAPVDSIWASFTTVEGMKTWMVPVAEIELKTGGKLETNYDPSAHIGDSLNIHNTVLCYIPRQMFSFRIGLTKNFPPDPRLASTLFFVLLIEKVGDNSTRVEGSMLGWGVGEQWDDVYKKFEWGNGYTFEQLYKRFTVGPVNWEKKVQPTMK